MGFTYFVSLSFVGDTAYASFESEQKTALSFLQAPPVISTNLQTSEIA